MEEESKTRHSQWAATRDNALQEAVRAANVADTYPTILTEEQMGMVHEFEELIAAQNLSRTDALMLAAQTFSSLAFAVENNYWPQAVVGRPPAPRMNRRNEETKIQDDEDLSD